MKTMISVLVTLFAVGAFALEPTNVREVPSEKKVIIEIDGKFPAGPATDVLFVVDDSGSMGTHQENLKNHISNLSKEAAKASNAFHIGITSTSRPSVFGGNQTELGQLMGEPTVITPMTKDLESVLGKNLLLGTNGNGTEELFTPVMNALSEEMQQGLNKGFYRSSANLAVIFLTDAEDQSKVSAWEFADFLVDLKGDFKKVTLQSIMVSTEEIKNQTCQGESSIKGPTKIEEAIRLLNGDIYSLCSTQMAQDIQAMGKKIFPAFDGPFLPAVLVDEVTLVGTPEDGTIVVSFGNQKIENIEKTGWIYDAANNKIIFGQEISWKPQAKGTYLTVTYRPMN